ncbi:hypothetical protein SAMN02745121_02451 [Nannocystis exedens]|uniref:Uncharacterized protein n=1 Tax=Nannocystis exedens TaxID=54 RepID=A0A1I1WKB7_9BACT|nr:hypothetical protein [Nannocystis exedens]PCC67815.1 hypothetical protein NAEX_00823 [Nannocystis exedens]SFD95625.1 hypothetical protein SAMN02745121_02451 [Nannocystis exedens]
MSEFDALPAEERRAWLLERLGALLRAADWQHFVCTPIVLPRPEFFPDRFTRSAAGVLRLVRRLFRYADLELGAEVELYEGRPPAPEGPTALGATHHHEGAAGLFLGIDGGVARFGADLALLDDPDGITATLAHEVAHAYRSHHALCVADHELEEELTDLTAVFLGFGVLSANAALRHRSEQLHDGTFRSRWSVQRLGYLSPQELCFVLAAQIHVRGAGREAALACLGTNQASYLRAALRWLERERPALASELGLPPRASWPPPDSVATLTRALDDTHDELERDEPLAPTSPEKVSNAGRAVFRVWRRSRADQAVLALPVAVAGLLACVGAAMIHDAWIAVVAVATGLAIHLLGRRRRPRCSEPECQALLTRAAATCPGCGGTIAGDIERAEQRLAAAEGLRLRSGE